MSTATDPKRNIRDHEAEFINWWALSVALTFTAITIYSVLKDASFAMSTGYQHIVAVGLLFISMGICFLNGYEYIHHHLDENTAKNDMIFFDYISLLFSILFILCWVGIQGILGFHMIKYQK